MPDADIPNAVNALMGAAYGSCGERCMAVPLVVAVGDATADAMVQGLSAEIANMKVGPGSDDGNDMGPLVTQPHLEKVRSFIEAGVKAGAKVVVDGRDVQVEGHEGGYYLGPCLFDQVKPGMSIYRDETTCRCRYRSPIIPSVAGSDRSSATCTPMAPTRCASTPSARP